MSFGKFFGGGVALGAATSYTIGGIGIAAMGGAVGAGLLALATAGGVLGAAVYGVIKALDDDENDD